MLFHLYFRTMANKIKIKLCPFQHYDLNCCKLCDQTRDRWTETMDLTKPLVLLGAVFYLQPKFSGLYVTRTFINKDNYCKTISPDLENITPISCY